MGEGGAAGARGAAGAKGVVVATVISHLQPEVAATTVLDACEHIWRRVDVDVLFGTVSVQHGRLLES